MSRVVLSLFLLLAVCAPGTQSAAADLGVQGKLFPLQETDILTVLQARLQAAKDSGRIDQLNHAFAARAVRSIERPPEVAGLIHTHEPRSWLYDPTLVVQQDIADQSGRVFAHAGDRVNPLLRMPGYDRVFVFIDGDDERQVAYGMAQLHHYGAERTKVVLVKGSPIELMRRERTPLYFDQQGILSDKFGLRQVPAIVIREGDKLRISEVSP